MIVQPFSAWWCCLNPRERNQLTLLIPSYFANNEYVTQFQYQLYAVVTGLAALTKVNAYFVGHYALTAGTILDDEDLPVAVYFFDDQFWPALLAFSTTDDFICGGQCKLLTFTQ